MTIEQARALLPVLRRVAYLNAGTFGPLARTTVEAIDAEQQRDLVEGRHGTAWFLRVLEQRERLRAAFAALVGAAPEQVALTSSTTDGCNVVLAGLGLGADDEVVTTTDEHFGLLGALGASPARVVVVPPDPEAIVAAAGPRTRLVAVSQVLWTTGAVLPVRELREATGVPVLVDGAQSAGAVPVDAAGLDFLTVSGQKWLCGPDATGALVVADPDRLRVARPSYFSQTEYGPDGSFAPRPGAARFDAGWLAAGVVTGMLAALDVAPEGRFERAAAMAERCRQLLGELTEVVPGGATLVAFRPRDREPAPDAAARLLEAGVVVRDVPGRDLLRASCGWWTTEDDLGRLRDAL